jgi:hypothetical protein
MPKLPKMLKIKETLRSISLIKLVEYQNVSFAFKITQS